MTEPTDRAEKDRARSDAGAAADAGTAADSGAPPAGEQEGGQGAAGGVGPSAGEPRLEGEADELAALRERHLRLAAEYENFRKRTERERAELALRAQAEIVRALLEPLDDLQRIADFDPATNSAQALHEGAEMVERKFLRVMESAGLETVDAHDQRFDPTLHEALTTVPAEEGEQDDTVAQVYRKGYRFRGILLRPAQVVVRKFHG